MASRQKIIILSILFTLITYNSYADEIKAKIKGNKLTYQKKGKIAILKGNAEVIIQDTIINSEEIILDQEKKLVYTDKDFTIKTKKDGKDTEIKGKSFEFHTENKKLITRFAKLKTDAEAADKKVYIQGEEITIYNEGERISVINGDFTTCDYEEEKDSEAHYKIKAKNIDFINNDRIITWNSEIFFGKSKAYWFPFLYIPLKGLENFEIRLDAGRNEAEGFFLNLKNYYKINDSHDGNIFLRLMEKKLLGAGFEHLWLNYPYSASYGYFFGNPINMRYFTETNENLKKNIRPFFEDLETYFRHEQWLPFLPYAQANFSFHKRDFYNINSVFSPRDNYIEYKLDFKDKEIFQPFKDTRIDFNNDFNVSYRQQIDSNINQETQKIIQTGRNNVFQLNFNPSIKLNDININFTNSYKNTIRETIFPNTESFFKSNDTIDLNSNLSINYNILPDLVLNGNINFINNDNMIFRQPNNVNDAPIQTSDDGLNQQLNTKLTLNQNLDWGSLNLNIEHRNDFLEDKIFPRDSNGNIIQNLSQEQILKRDNAINKRKSGNYINKLPELELKFNDFFKDTFPISISSKVGRYFEANSFSNASLSKTINDLIRTEFNIDLGQKEFDLGFGNKINFGGSGYKQLFYQTQDAQFQVIGQVNYKNDLLKYFIPSFSYKKVILDEKNNTPFLFDKLSRNKQDILLGSIGIWNTEEFTLNITNLGYDFGDPYTPNDPNLTYQGYDRGFLSPITLSLNSKFLAGALFNISANTSYRLNTIKLSDLNRPNPNWVDKNKLIQDIDNLSDENFSKNYLGISKDDARKDIQSLSDNDLKKKYGIDNRLYDSMDKEVIDNTRLTENDIGRLEFRGSKFEPLNLNLTISTPWEFNFEKNVGKEKDIPWGIAGSLKTNIDFQGEDFYKTNLDFNKSFTNFINKFQNTSLDLLVEIGGDWRSHTKIQAQLTLIPPELVPEGQQPKQTNRPFLPFNTYLSVKKDLHDFILSFDIFSQYVPNFNKNDFMFSINLEMTAFPFNLKETTSGLTRNISNIGNSL
ncbi:MAG: hypothetical protein KatS3mg068_0758 [Candidatus Sericytochromatia bacterium]|nr:MAG: hypothetical protein KatS3mg068_0758 [Candidatus Sericytochromatia bacterium]